MRVPNLTSTENLLDIIQKLDRRQLQLQQQISDGQKITLPEDDGMKMGRLVRMETEKSTLVQYQRNASYAEEYLNAAHLNLDKLRQLGIRSQELARTSGSGLNYVAMETNSLEVNQLLEEAVNRVNATHRKKALFGGTNTNPKFGSTEVVTGQRYEKKLSLIDNYIPEDLRAGDKFTVQVAGFGPYVIDTASVNEATNEVAALTASAVAALLRDKINADTRKTGIQAKIDADNNLILHGGVDEDFEFSVVYDTAPDSGYEFPNDTQRQTSRSLTVTSPKTGQQILSKTTAGISETLNPGDEFRVTVDGQRTYLVGATTIIDSNTGQVAQTVSDLFSFLSNQITADFAGTGISATVNGDGSLFLKHDMSQDIGLTASLETAGWTRDLSVVSTKVPEATAISLAHPTNWQRLTSYNRGDLVYYKDKIWESSLDDNFNHFPDTNISEAWKEVDSSYQVEREDWNLTVKAHEHRQYFLTPDGWLYESLTDAQTHVIAKLNQNADLETPQTTLDSMYAGISEVTMSVAQFEATGSESAAGRVSFDPRTLEYTLNATATGENVEGNKLIGNLLRDPGIDGKTFRNYVANDIFVYNGMYYKVMQPMNKGTSVSSLPANAGDSTAQALNLGTRLPSLGYNTVLDTGRNQSLLKGEYLQDLSTDQFYFVLEDFSTGGSTATPFDLSEHLNPTDPLDVTKLERVEVYESPQGLDWNQARTYNSGDVVFYENRYWRSLRDNFDNQSFDPIDLVDYYLVHPDDEFIHNAAGDYVQNDAWLEIGESFGHVTKFRADRSDWPQVIIAPPTRGGEAAEAEAVVDSSGRLVGLRLTNAGNYVYEDEMPQSAVVRTSDGQELTVQVLGDNGKVFGFVMPTEAAELALPSSARLNDTFSFATGKQTFLTHRNEQGEVINVTYNGNENNAETYVGKGSKISYYLDAGNEGTKELGDMVDSMINLRDALRNAKPSAYATEVETANQKLIAFEDKVVDKMGELAAKLARMQTVHVHDEEYYMNLDKRIAKDIDVDLSEAIVRMTKATTAYQASIQVGAALMNTSLLNFL